MFIPTDSRWKLRCARIFRRIGRHDPYRPNWETHACEPELRPPRLTPDPGGRAHPSSTPRDHTSSLAAGCCAGIPEVARRQRLCRVSDFWGDSVCPTCRSGWIVRPAAGAAALMMEPIPPMQVSGEDRMRNTPPASDGMTASVSPSWGRFLEARALKSTPCRRPPDAAYPTTGSSRLEARYRSSLSSLSIFC